MFDHRLRSLLGTFVLLAALLSSASIAVMTAPAAAEISPNPSPSWGVSGLGDTQFTGPIQNQVFAIEQIGDRLFVGGKFTEVRPYQNGVPESQPFLAAFDVDTGDWISSFAPIVEAPVYALQASADGSQLFVGGEFADINGEAYTEGLAAIDPLTGDVDTSWLAQLENPFTSYPVVVKTIDMTSTDLYVGGVMTQAGGRAGVPSVSLGRVARLSLADASADANFTPMISGGSVWGIAESTDGERVHLGGYFSSVNAEPDTQYFVTLDADDGELLGGINPYIDQIAYPTRGYLQDVEVAGDHVWVGGSEHVIYQMDSNSQAIERVHSTRQGGDYQDLEVIGDRIYGSCHCYVNHYADYDIWVNRQLPVPDDVLVSPIKYVAAYDAISGDYIEEFQLNASATQAGVWAIHGDDRGCLWLGGDLSVVGSLAEGTQEWAGGFARFCEAGDGALPAPTGLRSTFQDKGRIVTNWQTIAGAAEYEVFRDGVFLAIDDNGWFTDVGLEQGTEYTYKVRGVNAAGDVGDFSTEITVSTTGTPPNGTLPAPQDLTSTFQDKSRVVLNYGEVDGAASYEIFRDGSLAGTDDNGWHTNLGLEQGTDYTYKVRAIAGDGTPGDFSSEITVTTAGTPPNGMLPAPANLRSTYQDRGRIVLNYGEVDGAVSYEILRDGVVVDTDDNGWHTDLGLDPGTTYTYEVRAVSAAGVPGELSASITASTAP